MACKSATRSTEGHGWKCGVTGDSCVFLFPDSKACAKLYNEGPDAKHDSPCAGDTVYAIVKSHSTFRLYVTEAVVRTIVGDTIVLERKDTPLSFSRFTFPAKCWGTEIFDTEEDAKRALEERERSGI